MCPAGLSDTNKTNFPCTAGFMCPTGTGVTDNMLALCLADSSQCTVGNKCVRGSFCESKTSYTGQSCPDGTDSDEGAKTIYDCYADNTTPQIFQTINIVNTTNSAQKLTVPGLSYTKYQFSNILYPNGTVPTQYTIVAIIQGNTEYKIPFVQSGSYSPIYRLPLSKSYSALLSSKNSTFTIGLLAHQPVTITFTIEFLYGIYVYSTLQNKFSKSISFVSTQYSTRYNSNSFLAVLNRNSQNYFQQPSNLPVHQTLPSAVSKYSDDTLSLVDSVSISVTSGLNLSTDDIYPQSTFNL